MKYVNAMAFSMDMDCMAVLLKNRPESLAGKLCPPGGRVEPGESPQDAVSREFHQEAGVLIAPHKWAPIALTTTADNGELMGTFLVFDDSVMQAHTMEDEPVFVRRTMDVIEQCIEKPTTVAPDLLTFIALSKKAQHQPQAIVKFDNFSEIDQDPEDGLFTRPVRTKLKP